MCCAAIVALLWQAVHVQAANVEGWHREQTPPAPPWDIGKLWGALNAAGVQARVEWQDAQPLLNPAVWEAGLAWHDTQVVGVPLKTPPTWHCAQATLAWAPVSGNADFEWSTVASDHVVARWQAPQSVPNDPAWASSAL